MLRKSNKTKRQIIDSLNKRILGEQDKDKFEDGYTPPGRDGTAGDVDRKKSLKQFVSDHVNNNAMYDDVNWATDAKVQIVGGKVHLWKDGKHYSGDLSVDEGLNE